MSVYNILSSSSKGNAILYADNQLLLDIGVPFKTIRKYLNEISFVLITHIHTDHFNKATVKRVAKMKPLIKFLVGDYLVNELLEIGIDKSRIVVIRAGAKYRLNKDFMLSPVKLYHNVENIGLRLFYKGLKVFHATDTYTLKGISAINYDYYMVERNYCEILAKKHLENAGMRFTYVRDAIENHLSKQKLELWLAKNNRLNKGKVVYLHESSQNLWAVE